MSPIDHLDSFIGYHIGNNTPIAFITSGGTVVNLEENTVRFIDNFSTGKRGAISAEYFIRHGYAVIFLTRTTSMRPYHRAFESLSSSKSMFDHLELRPDNENELRLVLKSTISEDIDLITVFKEYSRASINELLLTIEFLTICEYLSLFEHISKALSALNKRALFYIAAAVSDFYVPSDEMVEHKIQSHPEFTHRLSNTAIENTDNVSINLKYTPKRLHMVRTEWAKQAFLVSFKLETDKDILISKSQLSLKKNNQNLVIANLLHNRHQEVHFVQPPDIITTYIASETSPNLEETILHQVRQLHYSYIQ